MPPTHATASCSRPAAGAPPPGCALRVPGHTTPGCTHPQGSASCYLCPLYVLAVAGEECPRLSGAVLHQRGRLRPSTAAAGAITAAKGGGGWRVAPLRARALCSAGQHKHHHPQCAQCQRRRQCQRPLLCPRHRSRTPRPCASPPIASAQGQLPAVASGAPALHLPARCLGCAVRARRPLPGAPSASPTPPRCCRRWGASRTRGHLDTAAVGWEVGWAAAAAQPCLAPTRPSWDLAACRPLHRCMQGQAPRRAWALPDGPAQPRA